jgi:hypothetical protein
MRTLAFCNSLRCRYADQGVMGMRRISKAAKCENTDDAWKTLVLVTDLIRHVETKTGFTLAAAAATGGMLFNLARNLSHHSIYWVVPAAFCGVAIAATGFFLRSGPVAAVEHARRSHQRIVLSPCRAALSG